MKKISVKLCMYYICKAFLDRSDFQIQMLRFLDACFVLNSLYASSYIDQKPFRRMSVETIVLLLRCYSPLHVQWFNTFLHS